MVEAVARSSIVPDTRDCEAFILAEGRLLDDGLYDEWLELFAPEATYWVPSEPGQSDPFETVSLMYDDRRLLETRVRRLSSPVIYSQEPKSRTMRFVTDIRTSTTSSRTDWEVDSKFLMLEYRRSEQRVFGGTYRHKLRWTNNQFAIVQKRVNLLNCDGPLGGLVIPF
ncbi:MAG: aromatic-ring-hydroxylating dioxygenase subunit beta [Xanthobacteraceae bacterium]|nr:aromatic-ring-hydroxylating dioxygenase subunit beta [Xanthobacteraceae bacterium]